MCVSSCLVLSVALNLNLGCGQKAASTSIDLEEQAHKGKVAKRVFQYFMCIKVAALHKQHFRQAPSAWSPVHVNRLSQRPLC